MRSFLAAIMAGTTGLGLLTAGCGVTSTGPRVKTQREVPHTAEAPRTERGLRVIVRMQMRDKNVTIKAGPSGPVYHVTSKDGKVVADDLSADQLRASYPKLYDVLKDLLADAPMQPLRE